MKHSEEHEEFAHLQPVEALALGQGREVEHVGQKPFDRRMECQCGHGIGRHVGVTGYLQSEDIGLADFSPGLKRKDDDLTLLMGRDDILLAAGQTGALLRGDKLRTLRLADKQRAGAYKKNTDHAARSEGDTFARKKRTPDKATIYRIAGPTERNRKRRTTATIRRTILLQSRLHKLRLGL